MRRRHIGPNRSNPCTLSNNVSPRKYRSGFSWVGLGLLLLFCIPSIVSPQYVGAIPCGCPPGQVHRSKDRDLPLPRIIEGIPSTYSAGWVAEATDDVVLDFWVQTAVDDFTAGSRDGVAVEAVGDGELRLQEYRSQGTFTSTPQQLSFPGQLVGLLYRAQTPAGTSLSFELRAQSEEGSWTPWFAVPAGHWMDADGRTTSESLLALPVAAQGLQYRVTFFGRGSGPVLEEVLVAYMGGEGDSQVSAVPPWHQADGLPRPLSPAEWGGVPVELAQPAETTATLRVQILPATLAFGGAQDAGALLRMSQRFYQEALGFVDLPYTFLIDAQGGVYWGRSGPLDGVLYIGILGAHPYELVSPTVEDALVALLPLLAEQGTLSEIASTDPNMAERLLSRWQAGNFRQGEWFLARGTAAADEHEWILLSNPTAERTWVTTRLYVGDTRFARRTQRLPGEARGSLFANQLVEQGSIWTRVQADSDILVERALYYGHDGDDCVGVDGLSRVWYLPGGTQEAGFSTTLTLLNPSVDAVTATVTVFSPQGEAGGQVVQLPPRSRLDLSVGQFYTASTPVGLQVSADAPIVAEQGVRFSAGGGGYGLAGTPLLSQRWLLAGIETEAPFVTMLALLNPQGQTVPFTLTLMSEVGTTLRRTYVLQPGEQLLNLNTILPELALSAEVEAAQPIAVARITFFNGLRSAHATLGAVRTSRRWYLVEGATGEPFETLLLVANPNDVPTDLALTFFGEQGRLKALDLHMPAHSRMTVSLNRLMPDVSGFSTRVESEWPVVVERNMYLHERQGGHASLGIPR